MSYWFFKETKIDKELNQKAIFKKMWKTAQKSPDVTWMYLSSINIGSMFSKILISIVRGNFPWRENYSSKLLAVNLKRNEECLKETLKHKMKIEMITW